jgi:EAL domain-containing protein (putative c-di-GMP-specific phosphodiesterase class I)
VTDIGCGGVSEHIIRAMIEVARSMQLTLVMEGVETAQQAEFLQTAGAEFAQGYYFGRPEAAPPSP